MAQKAAAAAAVVPTGISSVMQTAKRLAHLFWASLI